VSFAIQEVIYKNVNLHEQQLKNKHLAVTVNTSPDQFVHADYNMIDTAVRNLISNSIKFTEYNGTISIVTECNNEYVAIKIADNGVGISQEQLKKLFQLDKTNISTGTAGEKGTGLGLVIVREFIQINKGSIAVGSEPGRGTEFSIALPRSRAEINGVLKILRNNIEPIPGAAPEIMSEEELIPVKGKRILIIDDNSEMRKYLKLILSDTFEIFEAENGKEGILIASTKQPTAIVSDLMMPVMNGLEFCSNVKNNPDTSHIPVILLTSRWEEEQQISGYQAGADIYLTKPVRKELFIRVILNLITRQEKLQLKLQQSIIGDETFDPKGNVLNALDQLLLEKIVKFIESRFSDSGLDAHQICMEVGTSRTVLYAKLKSLTGKSVNELIKSIRLKKSIPMIIEGSLSISQIAVDTGFNSHSYFDKCFTRQYGVGPKEYISQLHAKKSQA
jgi:CheY-like chemotaxis protein/AraC-like DNA-binding protein